MSSWRLLRFRWLASTCATLLLACGGNDARHGGETRVDPHLDLTLPKLHVVARDATTRLEIPCKITVVGVDGTVSPDWQGEGERDHVGLWLGRAALVGDTVVTPTCDVAIPIAAGTYDVTVSNGPEREIVTRREIVAEGGHAELVVELSRAVDSRGWACGDLHVHSAPSIDSDVPLAQRIVAATAEGLDLFAPTDHDAREDWSAPQRAEQLTTAVHILVGDEISPGSWDLEHKGHFNVYPVPSSVRVPDELPFAGLTVPQIVERAHRVVPDALVQLNHPRWDENIGYFDIVAFDRMTGMAGAGGELAEFDAIEVWNGHELDLAPDDTPVEDVLEDWYALLARGRGWVATGNSDTHRLAKSPVGYPRTCVRVANDDPATMTDGDFVEGLRHGAAFVTSGPFLDVTLDDGGVGDVVALDDSGRATLQVHVQAPRWVPVDTVDVVVDGQRVASRLVGTERPANLSFSLDFSADAFVVVLAHGAGPLGVAAGTHGGPTRSLAFTNPIYVDANRDGMWTPPAH